MNASVNETECERDSAGDVGLRRRHSSIFGAEPRNETGNKALRSILKKRQSEEATAMAGTSAEGPRQRTTESTPITSSSQNSADYSSISPAQCRDASQVQASGSQRNGAATQEGTTSSVAGSAPQKRTGSAEQRAEETEGSEAGWWSQFWEKWGSVELENKGSVARDHLALGTRLCPVARTASARQRLMVCNRTHVSSLAAHKSELCFHRDSYHAALPPQQLAALRHV